MSDKNTQGQFLVTVEGIPGTFTGMTGGGMERENTQAWNGGSPTYENLAGPPTYSNLELTRDYQRSDEEWLRNWRNASRIRRATVKTQALDENYVKSGKPKVYPNCLLLTMTEPEFAAGSSDVATLSLTFATSGPAN